MTAQLGNIVFIIWRESVEALLVVGILNAWLQRQTAGEGFARARAFLWGGVGAGLLIAVAFAAALIGFGDALPDDAQQAYQTAAVLIAAALIVQMVFWMRRNGRDLKRNLHAALGDAAGRRNWWGVFVLAMIAVGREGSETAVFLYGTLVSGATSGLGAELAAVAAGFALAVATYMALQMGGRILSWRVFFRATEIMLLFLAASLIVTGIDNLADLGMIPSGFAGLGRKVWDTSALLSDGGPIGGLVSALTGYRARPALLEVITYATYWIVVLWLLSPSRTVRQPA
ncbi:FTR1 family protein [Methyloraptor flagellatus]|uniref:FTR1 family protein n=1 Tax=Methyloraptor flagellatus TaxID=3162530 RepID=A0AAU7X987_9HYPH